MNKSWPEAARVLLNDSCLSQGDFHSEGLSLSEKLNSHDFNYNYSYSIMLLISSAIKSLRVGASNSKHKLTIIY